MAAQDLRATGDPAHLVDGPHADGGARENSRAGGAGMSLTLYHGEPNGPSLTVLAALYESGLDADLVPIDLARGERHSVAPRGREVEMSIGGGGRVVGAEGEPMADSVFLAQYLDEAAGGSLQP